MKIEINYDLLDKIREAKIGISLDRTFMFTVPRTLAATSIYALLNIGEPNMLDKVLAALPYFTLLYAGPTTVASIIMKNKFKESAIDRLRILSFLLGTIDISTSYELLLESENYKTEYSLKFNESKIPYIKEDKYINIPTYDDGSIKEISVVQEHIIGSRKYSLSYGSPKKVLKPAFNPI